MHKHSARTSLGWPQHRSAGVTLHITSLPGPYGIGELGDAALAFAERLAHMQLRVWQVLPTGPTGYADSPYQPLSTFAGNELLIDTASLVRDGYLTSSEAGSLAGLPAHSVDFGRLIPRKTALLARAASRFVERGDDPGAYEEFLHRNDAAWLHDYALYRIIKAEQGEQPWYSWPAAYVERSTAAIEDLERRAAPEIAAVKVQQFWFDQQWRRLRDHAAAHGVALFGDLPIYLALDSADVWADRTLVRLDDRGRPTHVAGVPPDYFSATGQLWGNPVYAWDRHAETGYDWWIRRLARSFALTDLVRIDHFRGFESYWSIPASAATAQAGEWCPGPGRGLFRALREALGDAAIVAEDLGVITPAVEALRDEAHIPGMRVLQFDLASDEFSLERIVEHCVCYTGTHDNDTTRGWFAGGAGDPRGEAEVLRTQELALRATAGSAETIHLDVLRLAYASAARLAIAPMQDYLGLASDARLNVPGSPGGNWRWRLEQDHLTPELGARIAGMVAESGRAPS